MKIMTDDNFLGGTLTIVSKSKNNITIGRLIIYDGSEDEFHEFTAITTCKPTDTFVAETGMKVVRLKLTKQYYQHLQRKNKSVINKYEGKVQDAKNNLKTINKKINHLQQELQKF